jgi:hypothetical protein
MKRIISYTIVVVCFFAFCSAEAAIFNVSDVTGLQNALTTAQGNYSNDTINLASGTYTVSSMLVYSAGEGENYSLTIQGAGAGATILDGGNSNSILQIDQGALLDGSNANVTIRGVSFRNGNESFVVGGALYIGNYYAQTTIEDSVFQNNTSVFGGGALYLSGWSANIARCTFAGNSTTGMDSTGGAVYASVSGGTLSVDGNTFSNNSSVGGGAGFYTSATGAIELTGNTFSSNVAGGEGGGAYVGAGSTLTLSGNIFDANSALSGGGALISSQSGTAIVSSNIFSDNIASVSSQSDGGGLTAYSLGSLELVNNLFVGNRTSQGGAGAMIHVYKNANQLTNNTLAGNISTGTYDQAGSLGGGMHVRTYGLNTVANIYNNIIWGNTAAAPSDSGSDLYIYDGGTGPSINLYNNDFSNMNIWQGGGLNQGGNINADPNLDPDYQLETGSPCIDTGSNSAPGLPATDLGGNPRIQGTIVDMGAYEWGDTGSLQVTISPQGAIAAGAKWRVDGGAWHDSGYTQKISVGQHTVEFSEVVGWTKAGNQTVTISNDQTTTATGTYTYTTQVGSLQVTISPQGEIGAGAKWRVDGGPWQASGYTQTGLSVGQHTVEFTDLAGWTKPVNQTVTINTGQTGVTNGTYTRQTGGGWGSLGGSTTVTTAGRSAYESGDTQTGLSVSQHPVEFSNTPGTRLANPTATGSTPQPIRPNETIVAKTAPPMGTITPQVTPQGSGSTSIQWRVDGGAWQTSKYELTGLSAGWHTIEFTNIAVLIQRQNPTEMSSNPQTADTTATSEQESGSLTVTVTPQQAVDAGARWRVERGLWQTSGHTQEDLPVGQYMVEFSDVAGWTKPSNWRITISNGQATSVTRAYAGQTGSLVVTIDPPEAVYAGARWRVDGGSWQTSEYTPTELSAGPHTVEFSDVAGWKKPGNQTVGINNLKTTMIVGTFVKAP